MKRVVVVVAMLVVAAAAWRISERLSADAIAMGTGLMFGVLAGVPTALLLLASHRRRQEYGDEYDEEDAPARMSGQRRGRAYELPHYPQQPVIVLAGPQYGSQPQQPMMDTWDRRSSLPALPGPQMIEGSSRSFKVVGEQEEWIEDF